MKMKYLNKIIFINSATISYDEIFVGGNVNFTGNQGTGKSTVLRALVFFYNADKSKLGIKNDSGDKPFDKFYFRYPNSYILYEVMRDNGAYTVLLSLYQGRTSWRFIDAPYDRNWLIEPDGRVLSDWVKIRERIGDNIKISPRITSGMMFKDIIFGNTKDLNYARYAIVQTSNYQNISKSIQNVFLYSKLDTSYFKNIIAESITDDQSIDLNTYRKLTRDFQQEYDDIARWFYKAKDGTCPVRNLANEITEQGRKVVTFDRQLVDAWRKLNFAVIESKKQIPLLENKSSEINELLVKERARCAELDSRYDMDKNALNQNLGRLNAKLDQITDKRKYFAALHIEDKLSLADREPIIRQELEEKKTFLNNLMKEHSSIEEKYKIAKDNRNIEKTKFELSQKEALNRKRNELQIKRDQFQKEASDLRDKLYKEYREKEIQSNEKLNFLSNKQLEADLSLKELERWKPKEAERACIKEQLHEIDVLEKDNTSQLNDVEYQIASAQKEFEIEAEKLKQEAKRKTKMLEDSRNEVQARISEIDSLLSGLDGSFYEWLTENVEGWENNIGKLVDEEKVLYAQGLNPTLAPSSDSFFGVNVDLETLGQTFRTPDALRGEKRELEERSAKLKEDTLAVAEVLEKELSGLSERLSGKLKPLRQKRTFIMVDLEKIPADRKNLANQLRELEKEEQIILNRERESRQKVYNEALLNVQAEKASQESLNAAYNENIRKADEDTKRQIKELANSLENFKKDLENEKKRWLTEFEAQMHSLDEQLKAELSGKGVDTALLDEFSRAVNKLEQIISQIEDNRRVVTEYKIAERELFTDEPNVHDSIASVESQLKQLTLKYKDDKNEVQKEMERLGKETEDIRKELDRHRSGLDEYDLMIENECIVPDTILSDAETVSTTDGCHELIARVRGTVNGKREAFENLKTSVTAFNRNFGESNVFNFNTMPLKDADYFQIADDLQEFLDNNKIEEYRRRASENYIDIIFRISSEVGHLVNRRSDVNAVIQNINRDFIENNFAGVIRRLELRAIDPSDKMMQLLLSIQAFTEENAQSIGNINLFSMDNKDIVNIKALDYLRQFVEMILDNPSYNTISLSDTFTLQIRVVENDNDSGWTEKLNKVGSTGTDIIVKSIVNIMLINVFKKKIAKKSGDFIVHCMVDEVGQLHPVNIKGLIQFANSRNIYLVNASPTSNNAYDYRYTYLFRYLGGKIRINRIMKKAA